MREILTGTSAKLRIGPGTLYSSIKRMLADGLIEESDERPDPALDDERRRYYHPSDVSDEGLFFVAPYLTLLPEDAGQWHYNPREVYNALRWVVRAGASWRMIPHDLPP